MGEERSSAGTYKSPGTIAPDEERGNPRISAPSAMAARGRPLIRRIYLLYLPAGELAALLFVRHAARAVVELAPALPTRPRLVEDVVERIRQGGREQRLLGVVLAVSAHVHVFGGYANSSSRAHESA